MMSPDLCLVVESKTLDEVKNIPHFRDCRTVADDSDDDEDDFGGDQPNHSDGDCVRGDTEKDKSDKIKQVQTLSSIRTPVKTPRRRGRPIGSTASKNNNNNNLNSTQTTTSVPTVGNGVHLEGQESRSHSTDSLDRVLNRSKRKYKNVLLINDCLNDLIPPEPDAFDIELDMSIFAPSELDDTDCDSVSGVSSEGSFYTCADGLEHSNNLEQKASVIGRPGIKLDYTILGPPSRDTILTLPKPPIYSCTNGKCGFTTSNESGIKSHECRKAESSSAEEMSGEESEDNDDDNDDSDDDDSSESLVYD